jgi:predicted oxidoreductase
VKSYRIEHTDLTVSRLAFGCASLGGWVKGVVDEATVRQAERLVTTAVEAGITLFDHADFYGFGNGELAFGEVLKRQPSLRDQIVIQSKCGQIMPGDPGPADPYRVDLSRSHILASVEGSLKRLHTDRLDLYLLHTPDLLMDPAEIGEAFETLKTSGKVRWFGVSNFSAAQIARLQSRIGERLVVNQIQLALGHAHPLIDGSEFTVEVGQDVMQVMGGGPKTQFANNYLSPAGAGTFDYCLAHDIQVQAWSPLRGELLTPGAAASPTAKAAAALVAEMAERKGVTPAALALAWLLRHPAGIVPVFGTGSPEHLVENCQADAVELTRSEWYALLSAAARLSYAAG